MKAGEERMKKFTLIFTALTLISYNLAFAEPSDSAAEKLAKVLELDKEISRVQHEVFEPQIARDPSYAQYKLVIDSYFARFMSYEANKGEIAKIFSKEFTEDEMREIVKFYSSPVGQKATRLLFPMVGKITNLIYSKGREHLPELKNMLKNELSEVSPDMDLSGSRH